MYYTSYPVVNAENLFPVARVYEYVQLELLFFIHMKAALDVSKYIRSYYCHEMFMYNAIELKDTPISKLLHICL